MEEYILEVLKQIEKDYDVKILFACEAGSRAFGFASANSDYDIRFIYVHKLHWYLSIDEKRDVIEVSEGNELRIPLDQILDISGWELTKALKLYRKSNPSLFEWLNSNIVYYQEYSTIEKMKKLQQEIFSPKSFIGYHLNIAKRNSRSLAGKNLVKLYLYVLRSVLSARWIEKYQTIPPVGFVDLSTVLPEGKVKDEIDKLCADKITGETRLFKPSEEVIFQFILEEIRHLDIYTKEITDSKRIPTEQLNKILRETLEEVWVGYKPL